MNPKIQPHRSFAAPRGTTLIEAMMALGVFTVGILGILQMNGLASSQNGLARRQSTASKVGRDLIDAFERLPYSHAMLAPSGTSRSAAAFIDVTNTDTLHRISDGSGAERPLLGASEQILSADGLNTVYDVTWRVAEEVDKDGNPEVRYVVVMVRFQVPAGVKQLNFWTSKYNPSVVIGPDAVNVQEI